MLNGIWYLRLLFHRSICLERSPTSFCSHVPRPSDRDPFQDCLDCRKARILCFAYDCEQLEPKVIVCSFNKITNGTRDKIRRSHCFSGGTFGDL